MITCASVKSLWRGMDYFKNKKVICCDPISENEYAAKVRGSGDAVYTTMIDVAHPRKSKCTCPLADGKRIVCKHMIALYFTAFPDEADRIDRQAKEAEEEELRYEDELADRVYEFVMGMEIEELRQTVFDFLDFGPDWLYEHFVRMHDLD